MKIPASILFFVVFCLECFAQSSLGEILDRGARKVTQRELMTLLPGSRVSGVSFSDADMQTDYRADGTLSGKAVVLKGFAKGMTTNLSGTWSVDSNGQIIAIVTTSLGNFTRSPKVYLFLMGSQYYAVKSDQDRHGQVLKRTIETGRQ